MVLMVRKERRMLGLEKKGDVLCRVCGDKVRDHILFCLYSFLGFSSFVFFLLKASGERSHINLFVFFLKIFIFCIYIFQRRVESTMASPLVTAAEDFSKGASGVLQQCELLLPFSS